MSATPLVRPATAAPAGKPANPIKLPRRSVRLRLTALYGGLFLASGAALLTFTYLLVRNTTGGAIIVQGSYIGQGVPASGPTILSSNPAGLSTAQLRVQAGQIQSIANRQHANELHALLLWSATALAIMGVVSAVLGWLVAGRVLRPLRTITSSVRDISATNLHQRLDIAGPDDEIKELGDTFDALLARLDTAFNAQRQFVANASHELRTPLARQRTLGQVALADPGATVASLREAHERVLVAGAQQERLIDALLALARGQAGPARREPCDLARLAASVVEAHRVQAGHLDIDVETRLSTAPTAGDPRLVERLIVNLVDNAIRHNLPRGRVEVHTSAQVGHAVLSVRNTGPAIPPEAIERIFQPFRRLNEDRLSASGSGLGLSIVQAIAETHGARITARPHHGGGLDIEITFATLPG